MLRGRFGSLLAVGFGQDARERLMARLGHDDVTGGIDESADEGDPLFRAAHLIPGDPETVGMPQRRLAVMVGQLFLREDILLFGRLVVEIRVRFRLGMRVVEGIDRETAVDDDRFLFVFGVEHHPSAEAANAPLPGLVQDGVAPSVDHPLGDLWFRFRFRQRQRLGEVELCTAREDGQQRSGQPECCGPLEKRRHPKAISSFNDWRAERVRRGTFPRLRAEACP
ncbi:MAG: hypothetical protein GXY83_31110 [Rhodopirellula sp.]|nr:hypothetical protein [Rhodopirellula sp.]